MTTSEKGLALIEHYEGLRSLAYRCPAGVWTIGIGTTIYPDGTPVKEGDRISYKKARNYLTHDLRKIEYQLTGMLQFFSCNINSMLWYPLLIMSVVMYSANQPSSGMSMTGKRIPPLNMLF